ncbi:PREDICTED: uncharacterized protein LOC105144979 [Acromyrmex echinatior]|uniref:uncharacterized protein LOC105144979 n=1 Tax=Acromyrmex echinatior TaxID=103372 RepID=UPI0005810B12|nr:PREDICTED: uncharacterized protein LOC105144979 [Acromyrmex echinatior]
MAMALTRLAANIGGPGERRRCLYATAVMSVVLYAAPIWAQTVAGDRRILRDVRRLQRQLALRIIRGYRTISHESVAVLSGMVPFDIVADRLRRSYLRRRVIIVRNEGIAPRVSSILAEMERRCSVSRWRERLVDCGIASVGRGAANVSCGAASASGGAACVRHGADVVVLSVSSSVHSL